MTLASTGYIVADNEGVIHGFGDTADAAWDDMMRTMEMAGVTVLDENAAVDPDALGAWTTADGLKIIAASAALLADIQERGGAIRWYQRDGIACTPAEAEADA